MKPSILQKLDGLQDRFDELSGLLSQAEIITDQDKFRRLSQEYSELDPVIQSYDTYRNLMSGCADARVLTQDSDAEMRQMGSEELADLEAQLPLAEQALQAMLLPKDENDDRNVWLEIRAGTGGDEAALFSGDLFRMYSKFAEKQRWNIEVVSSNIGEHGGYKEIICRISGNQVYSHLKFESGAHRVQRVPATESQGRIHTSACTVAVMPEADEVDEISIDKSVLRIDTFRASGAGGQHVNKTDSAIRITHLPTGMVVECQDERSQHKNKARAFSLLAAKLKSMQDEAQAKEQAEARKSLVGSGDRSERIRTYNYPQSRVTDHRINLTLYKLHEITEGDLHHLIDPLMHEFQAEQLAALNDGL